MDLIEHAKIVAEYCKEHKHETSYSACDCPFSKPYNCGYLCEAYGYPSEWINKENKNDNKN